MVKKRKQKAKNLKQLKGHRINQIRKVRLNVNPNQVVQVTRILSHTEMRCLLNKSKKIVIQLTMRKVAMIKSVWSLTLIKMKKVMNFTYKIHSIKLIAVISHKSKVLMMLSKLLMEMKWIMKMTLAKCLISLMKNLKSNSSYLIIWCNQLAFYKGQNHQKERMSK